MFNAEAIEVLTRVRDEVDKLADDHLREYNSGVFDAVMVIDKTILEYDKLPHDYMTS